MLCLLCSCGTAPPSCSCQFPCQSPYRTPQGISPGYPYDPISTVLLGVSWLRRGAGSPSLSRRPGRTTLNFTAAFPSLVLSCEELSFSWTFLSQGRNLASSLRTVGSGFGIFFPDSLLQPISVQRAGLVSRFVYSRHHQYLQAGIPLALLILGSRRARDAATRCCCLL